MKKLAILSLCLTSVFLSTANTALQAYRAKLLPGYVAQYNQATGINNNGQIVGSASSIIGANPHVVTWTLDGAMTDLCLPDNGMNGLYPVINNSGQVACDSSRVDGTHTVLCSGSSTSTLFPGTPKGINNSGQIAGVGMEPDSSQWRGFFWQPGQDRTWIPQPAGADYSEARDVNNNGMVIGVSEVSGLRSAWAWDSKTGQMTDMGKLEGSDYVDVWAINDLGQAVGYCMKDYFPEDMWYKPFLWTRETGMVDMSSVWGDLLPRDINNRGLVALNSLTKEGYVGNLSGNLKGLPGVPGHVCVEVLGINDSGFAIGSSWSSGISEQYAVLWEPLPEPSSILALACGLAGLGMTLRRPRS